MSPCSRSQPKKDGLPTPLMEGGDCVADLVIVLLILIMMYKIISHNNEK